MQSSWETDRSGQMENGILSGVAAAWTGNIIVSMNSTNSIFSEYGKLQGSESARYEY
jgi:hypothetical protein